METALLDNPFFACYNSCTYNDVPTTNRKEGSYGQNRKKNYQNRAGGGETGSAFPARAGGGHGGNRPDPRPAAQSRLHAGKTGSASARRQSRRCAADKKSGGKGLPHAQGRPRRPAQSAVVSHREGGGTESLKSGDRGGVLRVSALGTDRGRSQYLRRASRPPVSCLQNREPRGIPAFSARLTGGNGYETQRTACARSDRFLFPRGTVAADLCYGFGTALQCRSARIAVV